MTRPVAAVTGGGSGIGQAVARHLADQGFRVAVLDINEAGAAQTAAHSPEMTALALDVTDPGQVAQVFAQVEKWGGHLEAMVMSAGATKPTKSILKMGLDDFRAMLELHLVGSFLCLQAAARLMAPRNYGRIVLIGSMAGLYGLYGKAHYAAAKAGLRGLTVTAAKELRTSGITVNLVAPGLVLTPMARNSAADELSGGAQPEEVAAVIGFLASPGASHLNGAVIPLDGAGNLMKDLDRLYAARLDPRGV